MRRSACFGLGLLAALCAGATTASAQYAYLGGLYTSPVIELRIMVLDGESGDVAWDSSIGTRGCGGGASGVGLIVHGKLQLKPYKPPPEAGSCVITVTFDDIRRQGGPQSATLQEQGCGYYHGASCAWEGVVRRKSGSSNLN
ncbi:hypothetical protein [Vineibacter terrae]|uniref:hypothetical protein n=1 Tax=Vineibacter terrae TaxID=2586908 RepID=UPI002E35845F|nr:hypothetical protein [Vineibacter terrae]HEX2888502.1 hypothetical protein [Vineibacter terrae]